MGLTAKQIKSLPLLAQKQIEAALLIQPIEKKKSKMNNVRCEYNGINFMSIREKDRYINLLFYASKNIISNLRLQVPYKLEADGNHIETYIADFVYIDTVSGKEIVEDCKGMRTASYKRKKKWMKNIFGIEIKET